MLQLIPGYRGYTIDSLRKLDILDDKRISADERHHFKGLSRRRGERESRGGGGSLKGESISGKILFKRGWGNCIALTQP
jgi:hypothetical protein